MIRWGGIIVYCLCVCSVMAQGEELISNRTPFAFGIYNSWDALQHNRPDHSGAAMPPNAIIYMPEHGQLRLIDLKGTYSQAVVVVYNQRPFIRVPYSADSVPTFSLLETRGRIATFHFRRKVRQQVPVSAYRPSSNIPYLTDTVTNEFWQTVHILLDWESGNVQNFSKENILLMTQCDPHMQEAIREVSPFDYKQLMHCIRIFDDRNPVYLKKEN